MAERATISQVTQIGVEVTPGTSVAANKKLDGMQVTPSMRMDMTHYRPTGGKFATVAAQGREWSEGAISGPLTYTEIVYPLASLLNYAPPVQQGATTAYEWTFEPPQSAASSPKTFTVEHGSLERAHKITYGLVTALTIQGDRNEVNISGTMMGRAIQDGITLTASPTSVPLIPVLPTEVSAYADTTSAGLGTTKLTRLLRWSVEIGDRYNPVWVVDAAESSFVAHVEIEPTVRVKLLLEANAQGMGFLADARAGSKRFIRIEGVGPVVDSPHNYQFTCDACATVESVSDFSDEDGVYATEWTFRITYDSTWGKALSIAVINNLSTL